MAQQQKLTLKSSLILAPEIVLKFSFKPKRQNFYSILCDCVANSGHGNLMIPIENLNFKFEMKLFSKNMVISGPVLSEDDTQLSDLLFANHFKFKSLLFFWRREISCVQFEFNEFQECCDQNVITNSLVYNSKFGLNQFTTDLELYLKTNQPKKAKLDFQLLGRNYNKMKLLSKRLTIYRF